MLLKSVLTPTYTNVDPHFKTPIQCRFLTSDSISIRRRTAVSRWRSPTFSANYNGVNAQVLGVLKQEQKEIEEEKRSLAEKLRMGSLTEDGLSYKEKFIVRCYEVGINKTATVETIANLLQVCSPISLSLSLP